MRRISRDSRLSHNAGFNQLILAAIGEDGADTLSFLEIYNLAIKVGLLAHLISIVVGSMLGVEIHVFSKYLICVVSDILGSFLSS